MSQSLADFHFLRPWFLLALPLAGLCYWWLKQQLPSQHAWLKVIDKNLLPHLVRQQQAKASKPYFLLIIPLLWIIACIAAAGPSWQKIQQPISQQQQALVIVLDLSLSMYAEDESPSRLVRAKRKIEDILQQRKEGLTALIVYSGDAHLVVPLTDDNNTIINLLPALEPTMMPSFGSNIRAALTLAQQQIDNANIPDAQILLLSDELSPKAFQQALEQLTKPQQLAIITYGSVDGAPIPLPQSGFLQNDRGDTVLAKLNAQAIQKIAQSAGIPVQHNRLDNKDIQAYIEVSGELQQAEGEQRYKTLWKDGGHYFVLPLLLLFLFNFRRGWLLVVMLLVLPETSYALSWQSLWQNNNQQGQAALEQEDYAKAAEQFDDSAWKSYSHYRAGNFEKATKQVDENNAVSLYNQGNAYTQLGQYPQAIESYKKALALDENFDDAKANKALVEQLLEQQKQQDEQQQDGDDKDEQQDQQSSDDEDANQQQDSSSDAEQQDDGDSNESQENSQDGDEADANAQAADEQDQGDAEQQEQSQADTDEDEQAADEQDAQAMAEDDSQPLSSEEQQALEQWLRSVPDDPGQLLRNKFRHEYQQNRQRQQHIDQGSEHIW